MTDLTIANTILSQLGGNRFIAMTGSKNFAGGENYLTFKVIRNNSKATHVKIEYIYGQDLYTVSFLKCSVKGIVTLKKLGEVYAEELVNIFEEQTGLATHL